MQNGNTYWHGSLNGYDWSRLALNWGSVTYDSATPSSANDLRFTATDSSHSGTNQRFFGFALRCLSTAVEGEESGAQYKKPKVKV